MALNSPIPDQTMRNVKRYIPPQHSIQLPNRPQNWKIMVAVMNHPRKPAALSWTSVLSSGDSVFKMLSCCFPGTLVKSGQANHSHLFQGTSASKIIHFIQYYPLMLLSPQEKKINQYVLREIWSSVENVLELSESIIPWPISNTDLQVPWWNRLVLPQKFLQKFL